MTVVAPLLCPKQEIFVVEAIDAVGVGFTTTVVFPVEVPQPFVTVSVYVPAAATVTFEMLGVTAEDEKLFGPLHA